MMGDLHWSALFPVLHRALANLVSYVEFPVRPDSQSPIFYHCAYWEAALYLIGMLLGWDNLAKGLPWWYKNSKDDFGDARLKLRRSYGTVEVDLTCWPPGYGMKKNMA